MYFQFCMFQTAFWAIFTTVVLAKGGPKCGPKAVLENGQSQLNCRPGDVEAAFVAAALGVGRPPPVPVEVPPPIII